MTDGGDGDTVPPRDWRRLSAKYGLVALTLGVYFGGWLWPLAVAGAAGLLRACHTPEAGFRVFGPTVPWELRQLAKRRRHLWRALFAVVVALSVWGTGAALDSDRSLRGAPPSQRAARAARANAALLGWLGAAAGGLATIMAFTLVPEVVAVERDKKRFDILLTTELTSREVVLGKLAARLVVIAEPLLVILPIAAVAQLLGGVPPEIVLLVAAAVAATVLMVAGVAAHQSVLSLDAQTASSRTWGAAIGLGFLTGLPLALRAYPLVWDFPRWQGWLAAPVTVRDLAEFAGMANPLVQWLLGEERYSNGAATALGAAATAVRHYAAGCLFVGLSSLLRGIDVLRTVEPTTVSKQKPAQLQLSLTSRPKIVQPAGPVARPPVWDHGVAWWDYCRVLGAGAALPVTRRRVAKAFAWCLLLGGLVYVPDPVLSALFPQLGWGARGAGANGWAIRDGLRGLVLWSAAVLPFAAAFGYLAHGANAFVRERTKDTYDTLLLTPLSARELVAEKFEGHGRAGRRVLAGLAVYLAALVCTGHLGVAGALLMLGCLPGLAAFGLALGLACGARAATNARAQWLTLGALAVLVAVVGGVAALGALVGDRFQYPELSAWAGAALSPAGAPAVAVLAASQPAAALAAPPAPLWAFASTYLASIAVTWLLVLGFAKLAVRRLSKEWGT